MSMTHLKKKKKPAHTAGSALGGGFHLYTDNETSSMKTIRSWNGTPGNDALTYSKKCSNRSGKLSFQKKNPPSPGSPIGCNHVLVLLGWYGARESSSPSLVACG